MRLLTLASLATLSEASSGCWSEVISGRSPGANIVSKGSSHSSSATSATVYACQQYSSTVTWWNQWRKITGFFCSTRNTVSTSSGILLKMKKLTHMPQAPLPTGLGENSFLVTKGFDAMKAAIARKAERVLERLADGSLPVHADEL